jgi:plasmid maintenance system antidote protein VapI
MALIREMIMTPSEFITQLCEENSLKYYQLSKILGFSSDMISKVKNKRGNITPNMAIAISKKFDISLEEVLEIRKNFIRADDDVDPKRIAHLPRDIKELSKYCDDLIDRS